MDDEYMGKKINPDHHLVGACGDLITVWPTRNDDDYVVVGIYEAGTANEVVLSPEMVERLRAMLVSQYDSPKHVHERQYTSDDEWYCRTCGIEGN